MSKHQLASIPVVFGLLFSSLVCTLGRLECEDLPVEDCAYSVSSSGTRCVLEKYKGKDDSTQYECQSSIILAEAQEEWIESDECVKSCGLERISVGLSTDLLMESHFTEMLCSSECLNNCPNLIDLYTSLAAGEGMYLPQLCKTLGMNSRRVIADPVKKAMDAEYVRTILLTRLTNGGAMSPGASPIPESGAGGALPRGPDYRGYGGSPRDVVASGGEIAPSSPVSGFVTPPPLKKAPAASSSKRPFFVASPSPSFQFQQQPIPVSAATPEAGSPVMPPEVGPFIAMPETEPAPSSYQGSEYSWQQELSEKWMSDRQELNDEENLYKTYFH